MFFELIKRLAGYNLDDVAEHIGRMAIIPPRCRLLGQRQFRDPLGERGVVGIVLEQTGIRIKFPHQGVTIEAIGEA